MQTQAGCCCHWWNSSFIASLHWLKTNARSRTKKRSSVFKEFFKNRCHIKEPSAVLLLIVAWPVGPTWQPSGKPIWPSFATRHTFPKPATAPYICARLNRGIRPEQTWPLWPLWKVQGHLRESAWVPPAPWSLKLIWHWRFNLRRCRLSGPEYEEVEVHLLREKTGFGFRILGGDEAVQAVSLDAHDKARMGRAGPHMILISYTPNYIWPAPDLISCFIQPYTHAHTHTQMISTSHTELMPFLL